MNRRVPFALGEYYHVYNRGVEKRSIFLEEADWNRFQKALFFLNNHRSVDWRVVRDRQFSLFEREPLVAIGAYCLMPNHFHILVRETSEEGISKFVGKLTTSYAKYFNTKYNRSGVLFQGRFKAEHVGRDEYLKYLYAYIHLNPVKIVEPEWREKGLQEFGKTKKYLQEFKHSSYLDYMGEEREEKAILGRDEFPQYFDSPSSFRSFSNEWLSFT